MRGENQRTTGCELMTIQPSGDPRSSMIGTREAKRSGRGTIHEVEPGKVMRETRLDNLALDTVGSRTNHRTTSGNHGAPQRCCAGRRRLDSAERESMRPARDGKTRPPVEGSLRASSRISRARTQRGTRNAPRVRMRWRGTVHVPASRFISSQPAQRTWWEQVAVKTRNSKRASSLRRHRNDEWSRLRQPQRYREESDRGSERREGGGTRAKDRQGCPSDTGTTQSSSSPIPQSQFTRGSPNNCAFTKPPTAGAGG